MTRVRFASVHGGSELAGGLERVLTIAAFDAAGTGVRIHVGGAGKNLVPALNGILAVIDDGQV